jgi:hypothetical protein
LQDERNRTARSRSAAANPGAKKPFNSNAKKEVADFNKLYHQLRWDVQFVGSQVRARGARRTWPGRQRWRRGGGGAGSRVRCWRRQRRRLVGSGACGCG